MIFLRLESDIVDLIEDLKTGSAGFIFLCFYTSIRLQSYRTEVACVVHTTKNSIKGLDKGTLFFYTDVNPTK